MLIVWPMKLGFPIAYLSIIICQSLLIKVNLLLINKPHFNWNITEYQFLDE